MKKSYFIGYVMVSVLFIAIFLDPLHSYGQIPGFSSTEPAGLNALNFNGNEKDILLIQINAHTDSLAAIINNHYPQLNLNQGACSYQRLVTRQIYENLMIIFSKNVIQVIYEDYFKDANIIYKKSAINDIWSQTKKGSGYYSLSGYINVEGTYLIVGYSTGIRDLYGEAYWKFGSIPYYYSTNSVKITVYGKRRDIIESPINYPRLKIRRNTGSDSNWEYHLPKDLSNHTAYVDPSEFPYIIQSDRTIMPKVQSEDNYEVQTITVEISYTPYTFSITPQSWDFGSTSTSKQFTVTSNASWKITDDRSWITNIIPNSGSGVGNFTVYVDRTGLDAGPYSGTVTGSTTNTGNEIKLPIPIYMKVNPTLTVSPPSPPGLDFGSLPPRTTKSLSFNVTSNTSWNVTDDRVWILAVIPPSGSNNHSVTVTVDTDDLSAGTYKGTVTVKTSDGSITCNVAITMKVEPTNLTVSPTGLDFGSSATSLSFNVTSNTSWTVSKDKSWITSVSPSSESGNKPVTVTVSRESLNASSSPYRGTVTVTTTDGSISQPVIIIMTVPPTLTVSPTSLDFESSTTSLSFNIISNTSWTVSDNQNNPNWLTESPTKGSNNGIVTVTVSREGLNASPPTYTGTVTVTTTDGSITLTIPIPVSMTVTPYLTVSPTILDFESFYTGLSVEVLSNTSWTVSKDSSWITSVSPSNESGNKPVTVTVSRSGLSVGSHTDTVSVTGSGITRNVSVKIIVNERQIIVLSPNGGATWGRGIQQEIKWISENIGNSVKIKLLKGGINPPDSNIVESYQNKEGSNKYPWDIPDDIPEGYDYQVKITSTDYQNVIAMSNNFEIKNTVINLSIIGPPTVKENDSAQYNLDLHYSDGSKIDVTSDSLTTWSENSQYAEFSNTIKGELTTSEVSSPQKCTISASYSGNSVKDTSMTITILDKPDDKNCGCGAGSIFAMTIFIGYIMVLKRKNHFIKEN